MINFEGSDRFSEENWCPEEEKNWPFYIKERFDLFNNIQSLNFRKIIDILEKNPNLVSLDLLSLLVYAIKQSKIRPSIPEELLDKFIKLADDRNLLNRWRFVEICGEIGKPAIGLLKKIMENDDNDYVADLLIKIFVRLEDEETAWEIFDKKIKNSSEKFRILGALLDLAKTNPERTLEYINQFASDSDPFVRLRVAKCLGRINNLDRALDILKDLAKDRNLAIRLSVVEFLYEITKENLNLTSLKELNELKNSLIEEFKNGDDLWESLSLAEKLVEIDSGEVDLVIEILKDALEKISEEDVWMYEKIIDIAEKMGEASLEILRKITLNLIRKDNLEDIKKKVVRTLAKMGKKGLEILLEMISDSSEEVIKEVEAAIYQNSILERLKNKKERNRLIRSLILRQEPFFANPFMMELSANPLEYENPLLKLYDIVVNLREKYPNLVGLSVLGSLSKGYWNITSDIDWGLIVDGEISEQLIAEFKDKCKEVGFKLCIDNSLGTVDLANQSSERLEIVFNGLFIGDREKLKEIQEKIINSITSEKWEYIRNVYNANQEESDKMMERFNFSEEEFNFIISARKFLWGLSDYETAKEIFVSKETELNELT